MTRGRATAVGLVAALLWCFLALLTVATDPAPPMLLSATGLAVGGILGLAWIARRGRLGSLRRVPWRIYLFGALGLFAYHAFYFSALRLAPAAEAALIAWLWPLLIVLVSARMPGERLRTGHLVGAAMGFGAAALILSRGGLGLSAGDLPGYGLALLCALTWTGYSVHSRRIGWVPTAAVAVFCLLAAIMSAGVHLATEETVWPVTRTGWLALAALGLGPVGTAFYVWDIGVKQGDIQLLSISSYVTPLLSTIILIVAGVAEAGWVLGLSALLITGGAAVAARASLSKD